METSTYSPLPATRKIASPKIQDMKLAPDPVGPDNDQWLLSSARRCGKVVAAWGSRALVRDRGGRPDDVLKLM